MNQEEPWTEAFRGSLRSTWWCQKVLVARVRVTFSRNEVRSVFTVGVVTQCIAIVSSYIRFQKNSGIPGAKLIILRYAV